MNNYLSYVQMDTFLHKLDPRSKFIFCMVMAVLSGIISTGPALLFLMAVFVTIWIIGKMSSYFVLLLKSTKNFILMMGIIGLIVSLLQENPGTPIFRKMFELGTMKIGISFEFYDIYKFLCFILRTLLMFGSFYIVIVTTNFSDIILALSKWHVPGAVSFGIGLVFQMIPIIINEFNAIMEAQSSRGLEVEKCGKVTMIKNYVSMSFPLLFRILAKGHAISLSMYYYKLNFQKKRTSYKDIKPTKNDIWFNLITVVCCVISLWLNATYNFGY